MYRRFAAIWFCNLTTDWMIRRRPALYHVPFVTAQPAQSRMVVKEVSPVAQDKGIAPGMVVADCRAILPGLQVFDHQDVCPEKLLHAIGEWCFRYTPVVAVDYPDGLILDISGCPHLWGGERPYFTNLITELNKYGYHVKGAIADTVGAAWAVSRYGRQRLTIVGDQEHSILCDLPPSALRLEPLMLERLTKLGFYRIGDFIHLPRKALSRRFDDQLLKRLDQALGHESEMIQPIRPIQAYVEYLPCLEPICTVAGIEVALTQLLEKLHVRLRKEGKGIRSCTFKGQRVDGDMQQITIATIHASRNVAHLFKLFSLQIPRLKPDLGFELFMLESPLVEELLPDKKVLWEVGGSDSENEVSELLDKIAGKIGRKAIRRYLPQAHYWPERSFRVTFSLKEQPEVSWPEQLRPIHLLPRPERISVTPGVSGDSFLFFVYKGRMRKIQKMDGPERIECEWWIKKEWPRDYYRAEDEEGERYWLFRHAIHNMDKPEWFLHGFFS
jgi:protein ImuB